jgi:hypothetical protein
LATAAKTPGEATAKVRPLAKTDASGLCSPPARTKKNSPTLWVA